MAAAHHPHRFFVSSPPRFARAMAALAIAMGFLVLAGWALDIAVLQRLVVGLATMKANTALALTLAGAALWSLSDEHATRPLRLVGQACALITAGIGLLTLSQYVMGWDLGIDQLLFQEAETDAASSFPTFAPGRMAPATAFCCLALGLALWLLGRRGRPVVAQGLALMVGGVALLALVGYAYGVASLYAMVPYASIALHTAFTFLALAAGVLAARPERGLTAVITSQSPGGVMARRLLPAALLAPFAIGWLRLLGERAGLYDTAFGVALFALSNTLIFALLIWWSANKLYQADSGRKRAEAAMRQANAQLEERMAERTRALAQSNEALAKERDLLYTLMDSIPDTIYFKDTASRFTRINRAQVQVLGLANAEAAIGKTDLDFQPAELAQGFYAEEQEMMQTGRPLLDRAEYNPTREGQLRWFSATKVPILDTEGRVAGMVGISRDITERMLAEAKIRQLNEALEQRSAALEATNEELKAFSYSVSHDLRSPLRSLDGFSQLLLLDYGDQLSGEAQGYLQRIRAASQRMGQLIDDLLQLSRLSRSEMQAAPVDLSGMVGRIAAELQARQPQRHVDFAIEAGLTATGDAHLLRVALSNLLENAWKFTGKAAQARIEFGLDPWSGGEDRPVYFVRDNGAGFDMTYANKLFGTFQRLHGVAEFEGIGIGLATVQRIIHRHGGQIWAESAVNQGATFYFTL